MARETICWIVVIMGLLQPSATFYSCALIKIPRFQAISRSICASCASNREGAEARRKFVYAGSLVAGSLLTGGLDPCFAQDAGDAADEDVDGGRPAWAVDVNVPSYVENKAWMYKDLRDGNIMKANTKLASEDIYYPKWMFGLWKVDSTALCVEAPLGEEFFGRAGALGEAKKDIGVPLTYQARFRKENKGRIVADRAFNVDSISRAAMGNSAVLECFLEDGNADRLKMTLVPNGAGGRIFDAFLYVTSRDQTRVSEVTDSFACSETSHQSIVAQNDPIRGNVGGSSVTIPRKATTSVKDIQVIQLFSREDVSDPSPSSFTSYQRISTFMTEDDFREKLREKKFKGPGTAQKFSDIKTTPIDVRTYEINYTILRRPRAAPPATAKTAEAEDEA